MIDDLRAGFGVSDPRGELNAEIFIKYVDMQRALLHGSAQDWRDMFGGTCSGASRAAQRVNILAI